MILIYKMNLNYGSDLNSVSSTLNISEIILPQCNNIRE